MSDKTDLEANYPLQEVELADPHERKRRMSRKTDPNELTEDEIKYLRSSSRIHPEVKAALPRNLDQIGIHITAHMKIARAWKAEADVLMAARQLAQLNSQVSTVGEARRSMAEMQSDLRSLLDANRELQAELLMAKSLPSMAVHSED